MSEQVATARMKPRMAKLSQTLKEKSHIAPESAFGEVYDQWMWLWENPDRFEAGNATKERWDDNHALMLFELGVLFGIDYEQAYPEGRNDEWPVPVEERPNKPNGETDE